MELSRKICAPILQQHGACPWHWLDLVFLHYGFESVPEDRTEPASSSRKYEYMVGCARKIATLRSKALMTQHQGHGNFDLL